MSKHSSSKFPSLKDFKDNVYNKDEKILKKNFINFQEKKTRIEEFFDEESGKLYYMEVDIDFDKERKCGLEINLKSFLNLLDLIEFDGPLFSSRSFYFVDMVEITSSHSSTFFEKVELLKKSSRIYKTTRNHIYYKFNQLGVLFKISKLAFLIQAIWLYADAVNIKPFIGSIPYHIKFTDNLNEIVSKLGVPYKRVQSNQMCYWKRSGIYIVIRFKNDSTSNIKNSIDFIGFSNKSI